MSFTRYKHRKPRVPYVLDVEYELYAAWQEFKAANKLACSSLTKVPKELRTSPEYLNIIKLRNQFITKEANMRVVYKMGNRYRARPELPTDTISEMFLMQCQYAVSYNPYLKIKPSSYFTRAFQGAAATAYYAEVFCVKPPLSRITLKNKVTKLLAKGKTLAEIATALNTTEDKLKEVLKANFQASKKDCANWFIEKNSYDNHNSYELTNKDYLALYTKIEQSNLTADLKNSIYKAIEDETISSQVIAELLGNDFKDIS